MYSDYSDTFFMGDPLKILKLQPRKVVLLPFALWQKPHFAYAYHVGMPAYKVQQQKL